MYPNETLIQFIQYNITSAGSDSNVLLVNTTPGLVSADRLHGQPTWLPNIAVC